MREATELQSVSQSVSQSLPHSYQRSTWSLHTLIFGTSVRWSPPMARMPAQMAFSVAGLNLFNT